MNRMNVGSICLVAAAVTFLIGLAGTAHALCLCWVGGESAQRELEEIGPRLISSQLATTMLLVAAFRLLRKEKKELE